MCSEKRAHLIAPLTMTSRRRFLRNLLVFGLIFVVGRVPFPWFHSHQWLSPRGIEPHLRVSHRAEDPQPTGLHFHLCCWSIAADSEGGDPTSTPPIPGNQYVDPDSSSPSETHYKGWMCDGFDGVACQPLSLADPDASRVSCRVVARRMAVAGAVTLNVHASCSVYLI